VRIGDFFDDRDLRDALAARIPGVVVAVVTNNQDPDGFGRVKVKFPWLSDDDESHWARIAALMAGKDRGAYFLPEVEDEVLVAFAHGDVRFPYVVGALWNGKDAPPGDNSDGKNNVRLIKSRSGSVVRLSDEDGKELVEIADGKGDNKVLIDIANKTITIKSAKDITLSATDGTITLDAKTIAIKSSGDAKVEAGKGMDVKAAATLNVKGATVNIN
jgi:uncharacterized protein involved in type VI secretion and phage assembly